MPLFRTFQVDDLKVGIWKVLETVDQLRDRLVPFSMYEPQFQSLKSPRRQLEWLAVRVLLQEMCGQMKAIDYLPSGKPFLRDKSMCISFSHTKDYVAVALHPSQEVGVDIEQTGDRVKKVMPRFIRADERWMLGRPEEMYALLLHWSAKETLFKLLQKSEVDFLEHLQILPFPWASQGSFVGREYRSSSPQEFLIHYDTHPDFVLTFALKKDV